MNKFIGTGVALVTPFNDDLSVDFRGLESLVEHNIKNGTEYLVISGTTGESATITLEEKKQILDCVSKKNQGRLPLVLGIGGNNTAAVVKEIQTTDLSEIDAILSVSPYYSKPTQEGIYQHFKTIAQSTDKPIILYNVPGRTGSNVLPETILRLASEFDNIIGVKEAAGNMSQYCTLLRDKPEDFLIISGDDDLALSVVLLGGAGVISVIGQAITQPFTDMIRLGLKGDSKNAAELQLKLMRIIQLIFEENNPAGIKEVLNQLNICNTNVRPPLVIASAILKDKIAEELNNLK